MIAILAISVLAACHTVDGDRILGRDVAAASSVFAAIDPSAVVGFAPLAGLERTLRPSDLARIARQHGVEIPGSLEEICFVRAASRIGEERLRLALEKSLSIPQARIEIIDYLRNPVPAGEVEFPRAGLNAPPLASPLAPVVWRGRVVDRQARSTPVWAKVRITVERTWVEAETDLGPGEPIEGSRLKLRTGATFPFEKPPAATIEEVAGKRAARTVRAGQPIYPSMLAATREVERGETVQVEVASGAARLALAGVAESSGRAGDSIVVRNPESGRRFQARVAGKGSVTVEAARKKR